MAVTPEGAVKRAVKKVLEEYATDFEVLDILDKATRGGYLYSFWPVQNGMGAPSLDCLVCYYGVFLAIETKAPGKKPTPRQTTTINQMESAGGVVLVIDSVEAVDKLRRALDMIKWSHAGNRQQQA